MKAMRVILWLCAVFIAALLLALPPQIHPDTASYLSHAPERASWYALVLGLVVSLLGVWIVRSAFCSVLEASHR